MIVSVKNLRVAFSSANKTFEAVRGIDFEIKQGEKIALVGESGSGKSAAAQALVRLSDRAAVSGEVIFDGENLLKKTDKELQKIRGRDIGMVFQDPLSSLNPTMRIGEQIAEPLIQHKLASKKEALLKAEELLQKAGVPDPKMRMGQYPHSLSGGLRQRAMIAMALACSPRLIIADEPTTALDAIVSAQILSLLKSLPTTLLLITHDLGAVCSSCDRVLVMYAGKIVEQGSVEQILSSPRHPYTRMLIQAAARIDRPLSERLVPIEGSPPNPLDLPPGCPFAPRCPQAFGKCSKEPPILNGSACWRGDD